MKATATITAPAVEISSPQLSPLKYWPVLAAASFVFGIFLGIVGLLLSLLSALYILPRTPVGGGTEAALLVTALVLLITGAHCEDRIKQIQTTPPSPNPNPNS